MQDPLDQEKLIERVRQELAGKFKLLSVKLHDFVFRKKLIVKGDIYNNYCLMRVKLIFKKKREVVRKNVIVYPSDVAPYVRKSLAVVEEMVRARFEDEQSYLNSGNIFYAKYDFDLNSIKSAVKLAERAFNKLLTCGLTNGLNLASWIKCEKRSFAYLNRLYWIELLRRNILPSSLFR
jgi:hypothetical protein